MRMCWYYALQQILGRGVQFTSSNDAASVPRGRQTERPAVESPHVVFYYEINNGQVNDAASVEKSRQTEHLAVESPHGREARLFPVTITRSRAGKATTLILFKEVDRQNARPSKVLTTERLVFFSDDYETESGQGNDTASVQRDIQNAWLSKVLTAERPIATLFW